MVRCTPNSGPSSIELPLYAVLCRLFPITDVNQPSPECNELTLNGQNTTVDKTLTVPLASPFQALAENSCQFPGTPFSSCSPRSAKSNPDPTTRSFTVLETRISLGEAALWTRAPM